MMVAFSLNQVRRRRAVRNGSLPGRLIEHQSDGSKVAWTLHGNEYCRRGCFRPRLPSYFFNVFGDLRADVEVG